MPKAQVVDWAGFASEILDRTDIKQAYEDMGVVFTATTPSPSGWLTCHAAGRQDKNPSAAVNVGNGKDRGRYKDQGGSGDNLSFFDFAAKHGGYRTWQVARDHYASKAGVPIPSSSARRWAELNFKTFSPLTAKLWCEKKRGISPAILEATGARMADYHGIYVISWPILTPDGKTVGHVVVNSDGVSLYHKNMDGTTTRIKVKTVKGSKGGLLNVLAIANLLTAEVIWKVEGLSDMLALQSIIPADLLTTHLVLTNSGGANQWPDRSWAPVFQNKKVNVIGDADKPGQGGTQKWLSFLAPIAREHRNVVLPYAVAENHGRDLRDWLNEGHTYQDLLDLAQTCDPVPPARAPRNGQPFTSGGPAAPSPNGQTHEPPASPELELMRLLELHVLGEYDNSSVELFSGRRRKLCVIQAVKFLAYSELLQIAGQPAKDHVYDGKPVAEQVEANKYSIAEVRNAIGLLAGEVRLTAKHKLGAGVWRLESSDQPILIDAGQAAAVDITPQGASLRPIDIPRVGDQILDFAPAHSWCDFERLAADLKAERGDRGIATFQELEDMLGRWQWKWRPGDPRLVAALLVATWVQTLWEHRPLVFVTGQSYSGKSILFDEMLDPFFGPLCFHSGVDISEAGLRQHVGFSACPVIMDEFEKSQHRNQVMQLARTSTRGGRVYRGTPNQRGVSFGLRHILWMAATETGLKREQDRNRFIVLELLRLPGEARDQLCLPSHAAIRTLGQRCLALAINHIDAACRLYTTLRTTVVQGIEGRIVDSFSTPAAMFAAIMGYDINQARRVLVEMVGRRYDDNNPSAEHEDLLRDILESLVPIGGGRAYSVNEIIHSADVYNEAREALERHGVALVHGRPGPRTQSLSGFRAIYLNVSSVQNHLLTRNQRWLGTDLESLLLRLPNAHRAQHTIARGRGRGIEIPTAGIQAILAETQPPLGPSEPLHGGEADTLEATMEDDNE